MIAEDFGMQLARWLRQAMQTIHLFAYKQLIAHNLQRRSFKTSGAEDRLLAPDWPWLRMYVLQRDGYRCRLCLRRGDEITLRVDSIKPERLSVDELLTLCNSCHPIAQNRKVQRDTIFNPVAG